MNIEKTAALVALLVVASGIGGWAANVINGNNISQESLDSLSNNVLALQEQTQTLTEEKNDLERVLLATLKENDNNNLKIINALIDNNHILHLQLKDKDNVKDIIRAGELGGHFKILVALKEELLSSATN